MFLALFGTTPLSAFVILLLLSFIFPVFSRFRIVFVFLIIVIEWKKSIATRAPGPWQLNPKGWGTEGSGGFELLPQLLDDFTLFCDLRPECILSLPRKRSLILGG